MDPAYQNWLWLVLIGVLPGLFLKMRTILRLILAVEGIAIVGLVASAVLSASKPAWAFGLIAMATPIVGAMIFLGSFLGSAVRAGINKRSNK